MNLGKIIRVLVFMYDKRMSKLYTRRNKEIKFGKTC